MVREPRQVLDALVGLVAGEVVFSGWLDGPDCPLSAKQVRVFLCEPIGSRRLCDGHWLGPPVEYDVVGDFVERQPFVLAEGQCVPACVTGLEFAPLEADDLCPLARHVDLQAEHPLFFAVWHFGLLARSRQSLGFGDFRRCEFGVGVG